MATRATGGYGRGGGRLAVNMPTTHTGAAHRARRAAAVGAAVIALAGCTLGPDYVRPDVEAPAAYKKAQGWKTSEPRDNEPRGDWWSVFNDPQLDALLGQVEVSNQTIKAAEARVFFLMIRRQPRSTLFPSTTLFRPGG